MRTCLDNDGRPSMHMCMCNVSEMSIAHVHIHSKTLKSYAVHMHKSCQGPGIGHNNNKALG